MTLLTYAINGVPIETYGLQLTDLSGLFAAPSVTYQPGTPVQVVGRPGIRLSAYGATAKPRIIKVAWESTGSAANGRAQFAALHGALQGALEIESADAPGHVCYGQFEGAGTDSLTSLSAAYSNYVGLKTLGQIVCADPTYYDRAPLLASAAANTPVALPIGTAGGRYEYRILGSAPTPTLTLYDRTLTMIDQMRFSDSLGSGDALVIKPDARPPVIAVQTAGVQTAAWSDLNAADTFIHPDPLDGPIAEVSSGTLLVMAWRGYLA